MYGPPALFLRHISLKTRTTRPAPESDSDSEEDYETTILKRIEELDNKERALGRVYDEHDNLLVSTWGLQVVEALEILKQFVSLYIYQSDNPKMMATLNQFYESRHKDTEFTVSTHTVETLLKDKHTRPPILVLMFVDRILQGTQNTPSIESCLLNYIPELIVEYLKRSNTGSSDQIRLVEILLMRGLCRTRFPIELEVQSHPQFKTMIDEYELYPARDGTSSEDTPYTPSEVFDFYQCGLELAFKNPKMQTRLSDDTLLYHGLGFESSGSREVVSKIEGLASAPLSTTMDHKQAEIFALSYVLNLKIHGELSGIAYCTLDRKRGRSGALWNTLPGEREILFPPGVVYSAVAPSSNTTGWGVPYWDVKCSAKVDT